MKKWYAEEYAFEIEVIGFLRGNKTQGYCRNGEEVETNTPVPMAAQSMRTERVAVPRS